MKRTIYIMAMIAFLATSLNSMDLSTITKGKAKNNMNISVNKLDQIQIPLQLDNKNVLPTSQAVTYIQIDQYRTSTINHLGKVTPFAYDPITGAMMVVGNVRKYDPVTFIYTHAPIRIAHSQNGTSWDTTTIFEEDQWLGFSPSIAMTNYDNATNVTGIPYTVYSHAYRPGDGQLDAFGAILVSGTLSESEPYVDVYEGPDNNNAGVGQRWTSMKIKPILDDGDAYCILAGLLSPISEAYQYGNYGFLNWYVNGQEVIGSSIPSQWTDAKFRQSELKSSSYQGAMSFDSDENSILYAAVNNIFIEDDEIRVPGVSKSEDFGTSWSDFNQMPMSLINDFTSEEGYDESRLLGTYEMDAFIVTGDNEYSYFFRLGFFNTGDQEFQAFYIMEAYFSGTWGIRKVAEFNGMPGLFIRSNEFSTQGDWKYRFYENPIGNELQAVKTLDGHILVKWIDFNEDIQFEIDPPASITFMNNAQPPVEVEGTFGGAYTTDVFTAHRPVNSGEWTDPINNTNDTLFNKVTWIPDVIASLDSVPMISHATPIVTNTSHPAFGEPYIINMMISDLDPYIIYTMFDADAGASDVETNTINYKNSLNNVTPNPVIGHGEISFVLSQSGSIRLELYNSLGQLVDVLVDSYQAEGVHAININASNYNSGTYYYTLISGTERITKVMNIVK